MLQEFLTCIEDVGEPMPTGEALEVVERVEAPGPTPFIATYFPCVYTKNPLKTSGWSRGKIFTVGL